MKSLCEKLSQPLKRDILPLMIMAMESREDRCVGLAAYDDEYYLVVQKFYGGRHSENILFECLRLPPN